MSIGDIIKKVYIFPIKLYQWVLSPLLGPTCRYSPTCSHYMIAAIFEWGILKGTWLGLKRIGRCNPWVGHGPDPVPTKNPNPDTNKNEA